MHGAQTQSGRRNDADLNRARGQAERILVKLKEAGDLGCLNSELFPIAHALNSRINDLRQQGHEIEAKREDFGLWRYWLKTGPAEPLPAQKPHPQTRETLTLFSEVKR